MSLTLQNLIDLTRNLVGDNINFSAISPDSRAAGSYTDTQVTEGANFAIKEYLKAKPHTTYLEVAATLDAAGKAAIPTDYLGRLTRVLYAGKILVESDYAFESMKNPLWETGVGASVRRWAFRDGSSIVVTPLIAGITGTSCTVGYTQLPALLDAGTPSGTVDVRLPLAHQQYLKYAMGACLLQHENDQAAIALSDKFMQTFYSLIGVA